MSRPLFILRTYNDIDHISPLIFKYIKERKNPLILFNSSYDYLNDPRINFLSNSGDVEILSRPDLIHEKYVVHLGSQANKNIFFKISSKIYYQILKRKSFFGKIVRKLFFNFSYEYDFLKEKKINCVFVEWGNPFNKGLNFEKIIIASRGIGIPIISLPHGLNIFLNSDLHQNSIMSLKKNGVLTDFSNWNFYDFIIVQTKFHKDHFVRFGVNSNKVKVWGSLRFSKIWQSLNLDNHEKFISNYDVKNKTKIVFMMPHWIYNVHKNETLSLISKILELKNIHLIIKDHTREDTGLFPENKKSEFLRSDNVEFNSSSSSVSLISWSDITINFGGSIGIEVLMQDKLLINPKYLTFNTTAFESESKALNSESDNDVLDSINDFVLNKGLNNNREKNNLINKLVYASKDEYDVSDYYYKNIQNIIDPFAYEK